MDKQVLALSKAYTDSKFKEIKAETKTETAEYCILPETTIPFEVDEYGGFVSLERSFDPIVGETYNVVFDGVSYICEAYTNIDDYPDSDNFDIYFGSISIYDNGEITEGGCPFLYLATYLRHPETGISNEDAPYMWCTPIGDDKSSHTISVTHVAKIYDPIDPKYVSEGGVGYDEMVKTTIVPEQTLTLEQDSVDPVTWMADLTDDSGNTVELVEGETYLAMVDGTEYLFTATNTVDGENHYTYIGEIEVLYTGKWTKYPFAVVDRGYPKEHIPARFYIQSEDANHTFALYHVTETIHPIDPKYLPEGGVGYSEVTTTVILPEKKVSSNSTSYKSAPNPNYLPLKEGETYIVVFNGVEYPVECKRTSEMNTTEADSTLYLGDLKGAVSGYTLWGTEYPFCVYTYRRKNMSKSYALVHAVNYPVYGGDNTITVLQRIEDIHRIEPKYLPEGGVGYSESNVEVVLPNTSITVEGNAFESVNYGGIPNTTGLVIYEGHTYRVTFNGEEYTCAGYVHQKHGYCFVGNPSLEDSDLPNTGEPFSLSSYVDEVYLNTTLEIGTEVTLNIEDISDKVHTIQNKFLPGVCIPYLSIYGNEVSLSSNSGFFSIPEQGSALMDTLKGDTPVIISFLAKDSSTGTSRMDVLFHCKRGETPREAEYFANIDSCKLRIYYSSNDDKWHFHVKKLYEPLS